MADAARSAYIQMAWRVNSAGYHQLMKQFDTADQRSDTSLGRMNQRLVKVGNGMLAVGQKTKVMSAAMGGALMYGVSQAAKLQNQYKVINNLLVTGGEKAAEATRNVKRMQQQSLGISNKYGVSQKEIGKGYEELVRRGYTSSQALAAQKTLIKGAIASGDDYSDVVKNSTSALEAFGLRSQNTARMTRNTNKVVNEMAYAADLTATNFKDLGYGMTYVGATGRTTNQSVGHVAAALGELSNNGQEATIAGTGLRKVYNSLAAPGAKSGVPALASIGLSPKDLLDSKGKLKNLSDVFLTLNKRMKGMNSNQKFNFFHTMFGTTGQTSAMLLSQNAKNLKDLEKQVDKAPKKNYITQLANKNMKTTLQQWKIFKQNIINVATVMGGRLLPVANKMLKNVSGLTKWFDHLSSSQKKLTTYAAVGIAAFSPVMTMTGILLKNFKTLQGLVGGTWGTLNKVSRVPLNPAAVPTSTSTEPLSDVAETRSGSTHFAAPTSGFKSQWSNSSLLGKAAVVGIGADIGLDFVKASKEGLGTKQGGQDLWNAAGKTVGGGIGFYLGGPAGAAVGASIGDAVTNAISVDKITKYLKNPNASKDPTQTVQKQKDKKRRQLRKKYYNQASSDSDDANTVLDQLNAKPFRKQPKSNSKKQSNPYSGLSEETKKFLKTTRSQVQKSTTQYLDIMGKGSKTAMATNRSNYSKLLGTAKSYSKAQLGGATKNLSYLKKIGAITGSEQAKELGKDKSTANKRVATIKATIKKIEASEKSGGGDRTRLVAKLNRQLLELTSAGANKQRDIYRRLKENTTKLTSKQYSSIMSRSRNARNRTVADARKQYDAQKSSANKTYRKTLSSAKATYGVHSKMYRKIKGYAEDQYDKTTDAAYRQYKKVTSLADKQAQRVILAAANAADGINGIMGAMSTNMESMIKQTERSTGGKYTKPVSNIQAVMNNSQPSKQLAKNEQKLLNKRRKSVSVVQNGNTGLGLHNAFGGKATGGNIAKSGMVMTGENGFELLQRGKTFKLIGQNGAQLFHAKPGDHIYKHSDALSMTSGNYSKRLPGYASGTDNVASRATSKASTGKVSSKSLNGLGSAEKKTKRSMKKISGSITSGYAKSTSKANKSISRFSSKSSNGWKSIAKASSKQTNKIRRNTVQDFDAMQKGSQKQMTQLHKGMNSAAKATTSDFGDIMGRLKPYAHKAMGGAITSLNGGISGINTTLSQFGGNKSVLKPIHYATGSNGPINSDQMAVLNDAKSGPRQELVTRGDKLLKPVGNDVVVPLKKGDGVLNGRQVEQAKPYLPHFAKGTGVSNSKLLSLIEKNSSKPKGAWLSDFTSQTKNGSGSQLGSSVNSLGKKAANSKGIPWNSAAWNVMNDAAQSSGGAGGGAWRHNPGLAKTNGFGASRSFGSHDGNDFSGSLGSAILAMHGGKVAQIGRPGHGWPYSQLGDIIRLVSSDGFQQIYQEFGTMSNIKVAVGDIVRTGQRIATLGKLNGAGSGSHVHVGLAKGSVFDHGGSSTRGWLDITKMHGKSSGTAGMKKAANSGLQKFVTKQLKTAGVLPWITKHITPLTEDDSGSGTSAAPSGSHKHWLQQAGIPESWWPATNEIISAESSWNPKARNASGAYGLPQSLPASKMASAGSDWRTNPITQLKWYKGYIKSRYGSIGKAIGFRHAHGWYKTGGNPPANQPVMVGENGPELATFDSGTHIHNNHETKSMLRGSKSAPNVTVNLTVNVQGSADKGTPKAVAKEVKSVLVNLFTNELGNEFG